MAAAFGLPVVAAAREAAATAVETEWMVAGSGKRALCVVAEETALGYLEMTGEGADARKSALFVVAEETALGYLEMAGEGAMAPSMEAVVKVLEAS